MCLEELEVDTGGESMPELESHEISASGDRVFDDVNDYDDNDDVEQVPVWLGFVEKPKNSRLLLREAFPSKAGGVPAWLDPVNLPTGKSCLCDMCGEPLQFLLQVYAPISEKESAFHRTLYVFMCLSMTCLLRDQHEQWKRGPQVPSRSVKVFRCQLPLTNAFYSSEAQKDGSARPLGSGAPLCAWCGTWKGNKLCSNCKTARYCSEKHQVLHWRADHKVKCQQLSISSKSSDDTSSNEAVTAASKALWPEFEIINEHEDNFSFSDTDENDSLVSRQQVDEAADSLMDSFEGDDDRQSWATFQQHLAKAPEQVLRYSRDEGAKPLWPTSSGRPSKADIPKCSSCGGTMKFELQILPQLLYYFGVNNDVNSLDWATIVVYTCADSCEGNPSYKEEFVWVQLTSQSSTDA
ncbi:programmed cell death protein 2-like [Chenopodium quinoa]|uniref:programmed cell death protein 2-like n=1 Tax=Chenopodium quinoa TaxID=63459 RepID=UPI000B77A4D5|nr:programmed cell death protein 2-like [Chenopodium quinoa]XP_021768816.1 programmed cell death protein 2-like [Chenopodium quinoa]